MQKLLFTLLAVLPILANAQLPYNGYGNNLSHPDWGATESQLDRFTSNGYADSISAPGGATRPNPREISNVIFDQSVSIPNDLHISDFGWAFGQFIDHDITFVDDHPSEFIDIPVPAGDPHFDPNNTGTQTIPMKRSKYNPATGTSSSNPRMHMNSITSWIDASNVYGSDSSRAMWLRSFTDGKLKTSTGNFLPFNTTTGMLADPIDPNAPFMFNENPTITKFFIAGDVRANEQPILTSLHTLFMREHNRICDELIALNPGWSDEQIYQKARRMVSGKIQVIVYEEWLPAIGIDLGNYPGYDDQLMPNIMNVFSAAAFRLGHTLINSELKRLDANGNVISEGHISLKDAFFNPHLLINEGGIEPFFLGMVTQKQQNFDTKVIGDLRNFLFGPPGAGGLDLVSININRGRERGLVDYNTVRTDMGLAANTTFSSITSDVNLQALLQSVYGSVNDIDPWVGFLAEDHVPGAAMGEAVHSILHHQFHALRDGDRFYFENDPSIYSYEMADIKQTRMSDIIMNNSNINNIQANVFFVLPDSVVSNIEHLTTQVDQLQFSLYPNPSANELNMMVYAVGNDLAELTLMDDLGRNIEHKVISLSSGRNLLNNAFSTQVPPGTYIVQIKSHGVTVHKRFVKI